MVSDHTSRPTLTRAIDRTRTTPNNTEEINVDMTEVESGAPRPDATTVTVGVPAESAAGERRVALVPKAVAGLTKSGVSVVVQSGAGDAALLPDELYTEAGAGIGDPWAADVVVKVARPVQRRSPSCARARP